MSSSEQQTGMQSLRELVGRIPMYVHRCRQYQMTEEEILDDLNNLYGNEHLRFHGIDTTRLTPAGEYPMEFSFVMKVLVQDAPPVNPLVKAAE